MHLQDIYHDGTVRRFSFVDFEFHMEPNLQASIHRDTAAFYKRRGRLSTAIRKFNEALDISPECYKSMYESSRCKLEMARPDLALFDAEKCIEQHPDRIEVKYHRNECLFDMNDFEGAIVGYEKTRSAYPKSGQRDKSDIVHIVIEKTIGHEQGQCLLNSRKDILKYDKYRKAQQIDERPIWKVRKEQGACDVVSVLEEPQQQVSKRRNLRNQRKKSNLMNLYFGLQTATDYDYLQKLQNDNRLYLGHTPHSNCQNQKTISSALNDLNTYENMLNARMPVYAANYNSATDEGKAFNEKSLYRIQLKTRKETFAHLVTIKELAAADKIFELSKYVEDVCFNYFQTKTQRVMPRKFEIISEIFNIVGIAYLRHVTIIPNDVFIHPHIEQLFELFQVPHLKKVNDDDVCHVQEVFGDKSTYVDPEKPDRVYIKYKKRTTALEKELHHCRHAVESCYINWELSQLHIAQGQMDEPKILAGRIVELADDCNHLVWKMLGYIMCVRADLVGGQMVTCRRYLDQMDKLRKNFDEFVGHFITTAILLHERGALSEG